MEAVVAPVLHKNDEPPDAFNVALLPVQIEFGPLIAAVILLVTVTVAMADAVQNPFVTSTVYEVVEVGYTTTEEVVAPVLHK